MGSMKKKNHAKNQRRRVNQHKASMLAISFVLLLLVAVVSVSGIGLWKKEKAYVAQMDDLSRQIEEEEARAEEIEDLEAYVGTDAYIEDLAKEKLGMAYENETIFQAEQ